MDIKRIEKNTDVKIEYYESITSTSERAKEIAEAAVSSEKILKDIKVVIAENQTKGKGTNGRKWHSSSQENILMTLIFYPQKEIKELQGITYGIAEMIRDAIKDLYDISLNIKLPNDLLLNGKKICGILTESAIQGNKLKYLLIGIGVNVNQIEFYGEIEDIATSLKREYKGKEFSREEIIIKVINNIKSLIK